MRQYLSVFQLMVRSMIYKLLAVLVILGVVEVGLFVSKLGTTWSQAQVAADGVDVTAYYPYSLPDLVQKAHLPMIWVIAVLGVCELLVYVAGRSPQYTLDRLGLSRRAVNLLYSLCHTLALIILFAFQAALSVGLCVLYCRTVDPTYVGPQTIFLAFYRVPLFHNVLPLGDWCWWLFNLMLLITLGLVTAAAGIKARNGQRTIAATLLAILAGNFASYSLIGLNGGLVFWTIILVLFLVVAVPQVFHPHGPEGEEDNDEAEKPA